MSWQELIIEQTAYLLPWLGGRTLHCGQRAWKIEGDLPDEHGWYEFNCRNRTANVGTKRDRYANLSMPEHHRATEGYLVADVLVQDDAGVSREPFEAMRQGKRVFLLDDGIDRFIRVRAASFYDDGPLVYLDQVFPMGPEEEVLQAYLDGKRSVDDVKGVPPALDAAFRLEVWLRDESEKRRAELERQRRDEEEKRQREERRKELVAKLGDGAGRRAMAAVDFHEAARAALAVGGATLLDERKGQHGERVVRYRLDGDRYECVCDERTLRIVDAGVCLTDHNGVKGDNRFTLESIPAVVRQAIDEDVLHVTRYV